MANPEHEAILKQGVEVWNQWRRDNPDVKPDLSEANLGSLQLVGVDFSHADLWHTTLSRATLVDSHLSRATLIGAHLSSANLSHADLSGADLSRADLYRANLSRAELTKADFSGANLRRADMSGATLCDANLGGTSLSHANLSNADLSKASLSGATLIETNFEGADISGCRIYGISVWGPQTKNLKQSNLIITKEGEPEITVDDLEIAQFVYLLLNNAKLRDVINTLSTKSVLILGRFTPERKAVLDSIREALRHKGYVPILFDFEKPATRNFSETVMTLASLSSFIIIDLSDPNSSPYEALLVSERLRSVPLQGIFCPTEGHKTYFPMYDDLRNLPHVLPVFQYDTPEHLMASLDERVIEPAEEKVKAVRSVGSP